MVGPSTNLLNEERIRRWCHLCIYYLLFENGRDFDWFVEGLIGNATRILIDKDWICQKTS